jgi:hypothetical protein
MSVPLFDHKALPSNTIYRKMNITQYSIGKQKTQSGRSARQWLVMVSSVLATLTAIHHTHAAGGGGGKGDDVYYSEPKVYNLRPSVDRETPFGYVGVTGLMVRIYEGMVIKVEKTVEGSPAEGMFQVGEVITGVNGIPLKGKNPFVVMGNALTKVEATDGKLAFEVVSVDGKSKRTQVVEIPVLGAYSETWPLNCSKSQSIIDQAAKFYADDSKFPDDGVLGVADALSCLFLLSTGDDQYLPAVKAYFDKFPEDVEQIGEHTWMNGYNGIACAEYYLRTGDKAMLPILQYFCDDAKRRQKFGVGWIHWGPGVNPRYVAGGLMNPAGAQVLTTLLLAKECGVAVDEKTLLGALEYFYRFAGHGTVPYGDHRGEGGLGSNGKDGMIAAAMQVAMGAQGDTTMYKEARDHLAMSMLTSYPLLVQGHADNGRGDAIWRSIVSAYAMDFDPDGYRKIMGRLKWWHDLSREPGGSIGFATLSWNNGEIGASGAGAGLSYTAPLKTLRITGAPRSKYAVNFTLAKTLWGTPADRAFLSIKNNPKYYEYGNDEPIHIPYHLLGGAYSKPSQDLHKVPREMLLKNVYHKRFLIRSQAAKALRATGAFGVLEGLMTDPDPRVRRAALDGLTDYRYWFGHGKEPIKTEQFTAGMVANIRKMLSDPDESWWVIDGALMAMKFAPVEDIKKLEPLIMPYLKHREWWLRESAFAALSGLNRDEQLYLEVVPTLVKVMIGEYHTMPRERMLGELKTALKRYKRDSKIGRIISSGLVTAVEKSEVKNGIRSGEGAHNVYQAAKLCIDSDPSIVLSVAELIDDRFDDLGVKDIINLLATPNALPENKPKGLYSAIESQNPTNRKKLINLLHGPFRVNLIKLLDAGVDDPEQRVALVDTLVDLAKLKNPDTGWTALGKVSPTERLWRYQSFDAQTKDDQLHRRERKRFRHVKLPAELVGWHQEDYDDKKWLSGRAPIGVGDCSYRNVRAIDNRSDWGAGELLVMRTTFEVEALDFDYYRLIILARQGYDVYLNGQLIQNYEWWKDKPFYRPYLLDAKAIKLLRKGTNVLAAYGNIEFNKKTGERLGQMQLYIEGVKKAAFK